MGFLLPLPGIHKYKSYQSVVGRYTPFFISVFLLGLLAWISWIFLTKPYSGIAFSSISGEVTSIEPESKAVGHLSIGDRIVSIDGVPYYIAREFSGRQVGEPVILEITRQGLPLEVTFQLSRPPLVELLKRFSTIVIAFSFWMLGTIVFAFGESTQLVTLFFIFGQVFSLTLGFGSISSFGPLWSQWVFALLLWWIGPVTFHVHLLLAQSDMPKAQKRILTGMYLFSLLFSMIDIIRLSLGIAGPIVVFKYLWMGGTMLASAWLLLMNSILKSAGDTRRRMQIAGLSAVVAFLPLVLFSIVPDALTGTYIIPYEYTFFALPILPLGYSYGILRYQLVRVERQISRAAAYALATLILVAFYGFIYILFMQVFLKANSFTLFLGIILVSILCLAAHPIHKALRQWVDQVFYGGWVDDRMAMRQIFQALKQVKGDTFHVALILCQALQRTMQLDYVNMLLSNGYFISTTIDFAGNPPSIPLFDVPTVLNLFQQLQKQTGRELGQGKELPDILASVGNEFAVLTGRNPQLWLLLGGNSGWQGLLIFGYKRGREEFNPNDLEILDVVLRQAGAALENERLLEEVSQRSDQIKELHRKVIWAREDERKRISRDLHDMVIQTLVGINYQIANLRKRSSAEAVEELLTVQSNLRMCMIELRQICTDLRPPSLDTLGLVGALESRMSEIQNQVPFKIKLDISGLAEVKFSDEVSLCIYRFLQEALLNAQKHSEATQVVVQLSISSGNQIFLLVEDDGRGFKPPKNIEMLVSQHHFGLIGLKEQVEAVGGKMAVDSELGKGCTLVAWIPAEQKNDDIPSEMNIKEEV